jgi:malonate transporter
MLSALVVVFPVFALIFTGWLVRRLGVLGPQSTSELNRFVVYLALPALLFDVIAHAGWSDIWKPGFIGVFGLSSLIVFALAVALRYRKPRHLADAAIDGLNAGYANTGFMGFPLALLVLGQEAMAPTTIACIITVCVVFAVAIVLIEIGLQPEGRPHLVALKVGRSLLCNPLLVAPALGALIPIMGVTMPGPLDHFVKLLGGTAAPCALVTLGLFLAEKREAAGAARAATLFVALKLLVHPAIAWVLATQVFKLPPFLTHAAVLLAALPTGTGPFMLAELYKREAGITSTTILVSTILSIVTVSVYIAIAI